MKHELTLYAALLTSVCLLPMAAMAADATPTPSADAAATESPTSLTQITLGVQWVGGSNTGLYGRYNGFTEQGLDILGGFSVKSRDAWDSGNTFYYNITGLNLNFQTGDRLARNFRDNTYSSSTSNNLGPNAEIGVAFGEQGTWGVRAAYNAISYTGNIIDSIYTINGTTGTLNNNLAPWGGASNSPLTKGATTAFTTVTLSPAEQPFQVGTRRDILQIGGQYIVDDWTLSANVRHEHKEGTLEESLRMTYGGMAFTLPVDFDTDRFDLTAAYNLPDFQAVVQYTYSNFTDHNMAVLLPYPVSISTLSATSGPYAQTGLYSTPPSTAAHYGTVMVGYSVTPETRITLNGRVGAELQNSTFTANSGDPGLSSTLGNPTYSWFSHLNGMNQGTSATSPDDVAFVYQGSATVASNLATDLDGKASYSFDGRNVHLNQYKVWIGGSSPDATANTAVYVVPQNWFNQTGTVEVGYRILPESNTKLTATYSFKDISRTNAQVEHSTTNTEALLLTSMIGSDVLGRISYEHADRSANLVYGTAWGNLETGVPEEDGTPSGAYYQTAMTSDSVIVRADYAPVGNLSGSLFLKYANESYRYPSIPSTAAAGDWTLVGHGEGIVRDYNLSVGPDINYRPDEDLSFHVYYTYERIFYDNRGNGNCAEFTTGACLGSVGYMQNTYDSGMNTAGFSAEWQANYKLKLGAQYNMSTGAVVFGEFNGVQVPSVTATYQNVIPYPNIDSTMHDLRLTAIYQLTPIIEVSLLYQFSMFHNNDWNDLAAPVVASTNTGTAISILTPGNAAPSFNVSTIGTFMKVSL